ncbi:MAG TPA: UDP-glucose 4-epimerase GalE [Candidatus Saccharibacteria bacterium]|nr:UDP-glucose 4-epimerase GalE [Candidatus Saccharibacteria bacterium]
MTILLTGGAGYIGTHTAVELLENGHDIVIVDNLVNSSEEAVGRVKEITGKSFPFYKADIRDETALNAIFEQYAVEAVIHFGGLKAVGESVEKPLAYYNNNVSGSVILFQLMQQHGIKKLVFSSSATVYGSAPYPYEESMQTGIGITNPYGRTKYMIEEIMRDIATANSDVEFVALRYFNPVGAHPSGLIGENPQGIPNNLMPFIAQTAAGLREKLRIFGDDYDTVDGTCVRDFIHVVDLAKGHLAALEHLQPGFDAVNLGSGTGTSVMQLVKAFENACGKTIPYEIAPRRAGDLAEFYANTDKAKQLLGWQTQKTVDEMCIDTWRWQSNNPSGYTPQ